MTTKPIKCARCNVPLEGKIVDGEAQEYFSCPRCGVGDTHENIMRELADYTEEKAAEFLSKTMSDIARKSKFITFRENSRPKKRYRFVVDLDFKT